MGGRGGNNKARGTNGKQHKRGPKDKQATREAKGETQRRNKNKQHNEKTRNASQPEKNKEHRQTQKDITSEDNGETKRTQKEHWSMHQLRPTRCLTCSGSNCLKAFRKQPWLQPYSKYLKEHNLSNTFCSINPETKQRIFSNSYTNTPTAYHSSPGNVAFPGYQEHIFRMVLNISVCRSFEIPFSVEFCRETKGQIANTHSLF